MAALSRLGSREQVDFTFLKTKAGPHRRQPRRRNLVTLEQAGYIAVEKAFVSRKPKTFVGLTTQAAAPSREHVAALTSILSPQRHS